MIIPLFLVCLSPVAGHITVTTISKLQNSKLKIPSNYQDTNYNHSAGPDYQDFTLTPYQWPLIRHNPLPVKEEGKFL